MKRLKILCLIILILFIAMEIFSDKSKNDKTVILPSTYGWLEGDKICIPVRAWIFELEQDSILRKSLIESLKEYFDNSDSDEKINLEQRVQYFAADNKRNRIINVNISGEIFTLPKTSPNGHTYSIIKINNNLKMNNSENRLSIFTVPENANGRTFTGNINIITGRGYSIISDIDDTIKESNVLNKKELIKNTFLRKFTPVEGMPELYRKFEKKGFAFHYISGSPWQLYPVIENFLRDEQFPRGSVELKLFRLKDRSFINFLTADQMQYKINAIRTVLERFPERNFILIGDSGEKDPEIYSEIASQYKHRIKYIFIRDAGLISGNETRIKSIKNKARDVKVIIFKKTGELEAYTSNF